MKSQSLAGLALVIGAVLALVYGGFSYTKDTHDLKLGPMEVSIAEKQTVNIPLWAGVIALVAGGALLVTARRR